MDYRNKGIINSTLLLIARHPASSLRSGIGQVITKSESSSTTNLGGLQNVKLMFDVCIKWPLMYPISFKYFAVPPPKGKRYKIILNIFSKPHFCYSLVISII